jgi:predicted AAA+ superfamily ATPase
MILRTCKPSNKNSFFLFGPRGSGKTTFLKETFADKNTLYVDLLDIDFFDQLILDPSRFKALIDAPSNIHKRVIVDEVQKLPKLLDVVHSQIQERKRQFILTVSSSRRLKQKGTNLLAGRAWVYHLYPLSSFELGEQFDLKKYLEVGGLPDAYLAETNADAAEYLRAYVSTYLQKEIQEEQWVKKLEPFRKFLAIAAQMNGQIINKSKMASDVGVNDVTVSNYFEILEDTLIGFLLPAYHESVRKAQKQHPKFYFIDPGMKRALDRTLSVELLPQTSLWGNAFEHFVILEIKKLISYKRLDWELSYLRTKDDVEIDLIINRPGEKKLLIEIKSTNRVGASDAKALETLGEDIDRKAERYLLSNDRLSQVFGKTKALYWQEALNKIF